MNNHQAKELLCFSKRFKKCYGEEINTINDLFAIFCKHCKCLGYEPIIFDCGFIGLLADTQEFLIAQGIINSSQCMRT